jgi:hypothetical protein
VEKGVEILWKLSLAFLLRGLATLSSLPPKAEFLAVVYLRNASVALNFAL